jgi:hypothetical protein
MLLTDFNFRGGENKMIPDSGFLIPDS